MQSQVEQFFNHFKSHSNTFYDKEMPLRFRMIKTSDTSTTGLYDLVFQISLCDILPIAEYSKESVFAIQDLSFTLDVSNPKLDSFVTVKFGSALVDEPDYVPGEIVLSPQVTRTILMENPVTYTMDESQIKIPWDFFVHNTFNQCNFNVEYDEMGDPILHYSDDLRKNTTTLGRFHANFLDIYSDMYCSLYVPTGQKDFIEEFLPTQSLFVDNPLVLELRVRNGFIPLQDFWETFWLAQQLPFGSFLDLHVQFLRDVYYPLLFTLGTFDLADIMYHVNDADECPVFEPPHKRQRK